MKTYRRRSMETRNEPGVDHASGLQSTSSRPRPRHDIHQTRKSMTNKVFPFCSPLSSASQEFKGRTVNIIKQRNFILLPSPSEMVQRETKEGPHANPHEVIVVYHTTELTLCPQTKFSPTPPTHKPKTSSANITTACYKDTLIPLHCHSCGNMPGSTILGGEDPRLACGS
ncbi:unnamed protein product [Boreogadus saida]